MKRVLLQVIGLGIVVDLQPHEVWRLGPRALFVGACLLALVTIGLLPGCHENPCVAPCVQACAAIGETPRPVGNQALGCDCNCPTEQP